jgi:hypothetical protein
MPVKMNDRSCDTCRKYHRIDCPNSYWCNSSPSKPLWSPRSDVVFVLEKRKFPTLRNKICALIMVGCGLVPVFLEHDGTVFILTLIFGIPLFFAKENWMG